MRRLLAQFRSRGQAPSGQRAQVERAGRSRQACTWRVIVAFVLVLSMGLGLTAQWATAQARREAENAVAAQIAEFEDQVQLCRTALEVCLSRYGVVLRGAQGLFAASKSVERREWRAYARTALDKAGFPSARAMTAITRVRAAGVEDFLQQTRADDAPAFAIWPAPARAPGDEYWVVTHVSSDAESASLGRDLRDDAPAAEAMRQTAETDRPRSTVETRESGGVPGTDLVIYLPLYSNGVPLGGAEERRAALWGWVSLGVEVGALMDEIGAAKFLPPGHTLSLFDGKAPGGRPLGAVSGADSADLREAPARESSIERTFAVSVLGRPLAARVTMPGPVAGAWDFVPWPLSAFGAAASLLAGALVAGLVQMRERAEAAAAGLERTVEKRTAELDRFFTLSLDLLCIAGTDGYFKRLSPVWARTLGYSQEELLGRPWIEFVHPDDQAATIEAGARLEEGCEILAFENRYRCKDGGYRWMLWSAVLDPSGDTIYAAARDVTERKAAEAELREAKASADAANRAKSDFLAHMSHEIRTPLNGVMGMIDLLCESGLTEQQRRFAVLGKASAESLTSIINDILDLSKIEAGKMEIVPVDFDLHEAVEGVVEVLAQKALHKGLEMACHVEAEVPALVHGDSDRLRQVLINLINNAVKFTRRGSVVVRVTLDDQSEGRAVVRFAITDTGVGIAPDRIGRLFRPFSQADALTAREYGGTGLGLAISKQIVGLLGGTIGVESEPGRGSTFWFTVALPTVSAPRPTARQQVDPRTLRVLAVDDSTIQREVLSRQLRAWGLQADVAEGGEHALAMLTAASAEGAPFRVAIVDRDMPGMDGFDLAMAVRARDVIRDTVLMILLTVEDRVDPRHLASMGFAGWMSKPVRQSQLFDAIMRAIAAARQDPVATVEPAGASGERAHAPGVPARVLVAEDNEVNQVVATEVLLRSGYQCDVVGDGQKAVEAVKGGGYDLVLMDCQMPVMDGFEATRAIRDHERSSALPPIPIIALTANAMKGDKEVCLEAGMDGYASKPIDPPKLLSTIDALLSARRAA